MGREAESMSFSRVTAAILAGGLGSRLRKVVSDRPKPLAQVAGRPFMSYLLDQLCGTPVSHVVLCTGYMGDIIASELGTSYGPLTLTYSHEPVALGTAGALRLAVPFLLSSEVLVLNGDSYCDVDMERLLDAHRQRRASITMVVTPVHDAARYGAVLLDRDEKIISFGENGGERGRGWVNAGVYVIDRAVISGLPAGCPISLERDVFPRLAGQAMRAFPTKGCFIDIGLPADYKRSQTVLSRVGLQHVTEEPIR
jgi:D-glycero-alpha-D-manno-heptose 1-phosphate guanylyltransferase